MLNLYRMGIFSDTNILLESFDILAEVDNYVKSNYNYVKKIDNVYIAYQSAWDDAPSILKIEEEKEIQTFKGICLVFETNDNRKIVLSIGLEKQFSIVIYNDGSWENWNSDNEPEPIFKTSYDAKWIAGNAAMRIVSLENSHIGIIVRKGNKR